MGKLSGKVVILTGASGGIGKQVAIRMAEEGAKLVICARRKEKLEDTKRLCEEAGAEVLAVQCDVSEREQLENLVNQTIERFGTINVLVNNAMSSISGVPFIHQTMEDLEMTLKNNLYAIWTLMQLCYPHMKAAGGGSIVNVGSGSSQVGLVNCAAYASVKGALTSLTKVVANEWGVDGIRANLVHPATYTDTIAEGLTNVPAEVAEEYFKQTKAALANNPLKRMGDPYEDVAPVYVFLASDDSKFMTGQILRVEGGQLMV